MKLFKISLITLFTHFVLLSSAQITVVTADKGPATNGDGIYYSLPATVFKVDVDIKKTEYIQGPLANYSENYLGTSDYLKGSKTEYSIIDIDVKPITVADEKSSYYIVFSDKTSKEEKPPKVSLTPFGTLRSVNMTEAENNENMVSIEENKTIIMGGNDTRFRYEAEYNRKKKVDTVIRKITIDTMTINKFLFKTSWIDKSKEERAEEAARQIRLIRESRMNLLTGYHEVNFGESLRYMDNQLQKMEQQYLELFLGKQHISFEHYTFFVEPEIENRQKVLLETESADKLVFNADPQPLELIKPMSGVQNNIVYYRIPALTTIKVKFNGETFFNDIIPVSQMGVITGVSVYKAGVLFDPKTGIPVEISKH
jgi:hypothetical protein